MERHLNGSMGPAYYYDRTRVESAIIIVSNHAVTWFILLVGLPSLQARRDYGWWIIPFNPSYDILRIPNDNRPFVMDTSIVPVSFSTRFSSKIFCTNYAYPLRF